MKQTLIDLSLPRQGNARITARVLHISPDTVLNELRGEEVALQSVNTARLRILNPDDIAVDIERAGEAERDEMWSFVGKMQDQRWLWHAIDHGTGAVLAYVCGRHKDEVFLNSKRCWSPSGSARFYPDYWGAYPQHVEPGRA